MQLMWHNYVMRRWYFDHAAATPVAPSVIKIMEPYFANEYANPSAIYEEGVMARNAIEDAREKIANSLEVNKKSLIFTSSSTESIFLGIVGSVNAWKEDHENETPEIILSSIEHDAVIMTARYLEKQGAILHFIPVDTEGFVDINFIKSKINNNTVVVSVGLVNNEIGTIQRMHEIAKMVRAWKKDNRGVTRDREVVGDNLYPLLHTDGTQAICYYGLSIPKLGCDLFSCNSSKIYGPKGVGLLYKNLNVKILPAMIDGSQEFGLRAGTEPVALIAGFAEAFKLAQENAINETFRLVPIRDMLFSELEKIADKNKIKIVINGPRSVERVVNNVNVSFEGINHEYLAILLDSEGFAVSTKSACNEREAEESHVLYALNQAEDKDGERPLSGLRITMGSSTTERSVRELISAIDRVILLALNSPKIN